MKQGQVKPTDTSQGEARRILRRKRARKLFIEAAQALIEKYGVKHLSVRKIANATGHGSATIYSYFADLDELLLFASLKYRREYLLELSRKLHPGMSALEQYRGIYEIFNRFSFAEPALFMNLYFGVHAHRIETIFDAYYDLYPEEETALPDFLYEALQKRNLFRCDQVFVGRLAREGYILPDHVDLIANMMVRLQQTFLHDLTICPTLDQRIQSQRFLEMFDHILALSVPSDPPKASESA